MPYSLYGGPHDGQQVDIGKLARGRYSVLLPGTGGEGPVEYHLRTVRAKLTGGGTLMIDVLAHSPYSQVDLWDRVLRDFADEIEGTEIRQYEHRHTRGGTEGRARAHLRLVDPPGRPPPASSGAAAG